LAPGASIGKSEGPLIVFPSEGECAIEFRVSGSYVRASFLLTEASFSKFKDTSCTYSLSRVNLTVLVRLSWCDLLALALLRVLLTEVGFSIFIGKRKADKWSFVD